MTLNVRCKLHGLHVSYLQSTHNDLGSPSLLWSLEQELSLALYSHCQGQGLAFCIPSVWQSRQSPVNTEQNSRGQPVFLSTASSPVKILMVAGFLLTFVRAGRRILSQRISPRSLGMGSTIPNRMGICLLEGRGRREDLDIESQWGYRKVSGLSKIPPGPQSPWWNTSWGILRSGIQQKHLCCPRTLTHEKRLEKADPKAPLLKICLISHGFLQPGWLLRISLFLGSILV